MQAGVEWLIEAEGCAPAALRDALALRRLLDDVVARLDLKVVGAPQWHVFPGAAGVTGLYLLSESHLTIHTYPEFALAALNLYTCRPKAEYPWEVELRERLQAREVRLRGFSRGPTGAERGPAAAEATPKSDHG